MINRLRMHRFDERQIFHHRGGMRQQLAQPDSVAAVIILLEFKDRRRDGELILSRCHRCEALPHADRLRQICVKPFPHFRLVVKQVEL